MGFVIATVSCPNCGGKDCDQVLEMATLTTTKECPDCGYQHLHYYKRNEFGQFELKDDLSIFVDMIPNNLIPQEKFLNNPFGVIVTTRPWNQKSCKCLETEEEYKNTVKQICDPANITSDILTIVYSHFTDGKIIKTTLYTKENQ
jgi:Zn ribbon nucleic-acid-binding protein